MAAEPRLVVPQCGHLIARPGWKPSRPTRQLVSTESGVVGAVFSVVVHHVPGRRSPCSEPLRPSHVSSFTMFRGADTMFWRLTPLFSRVDTMFSGSGNHVPRGGKCVPRDEHHVRWHGNHVLEHRSPCSGGSCTMFPRAETLLRSVVTHVPSG
jgi:hypothetical protein